MKVFCEKIFGWEVQLLESNDNYKKFKIGYKGVVSYIIAEWQDGALSNLMPKGGIFETHSDFKSLAEAKNCPSLLRKLFGLAKLVEQKEKPREPDTPVGSAQ